MARALAPATCHARNARNSQRNAAMAAMCNTMYPHFGSVLTPSFLGVLFMLFFECSDSQAERYRSAVPVQDNLDGFKWLILKVWKGWTTAEHKT